MVQAVLTALDTWMAREWRDRERSWRAQQRTWREEDIAFRNEERRFRLLEQRFFDLRKRWRNEDVKQRRVENFRYLWNRFTELNRRDVEEKSEQLRSLSWLTGLITSMTMTSPVEFSYASQQISTVWMTSYAVCTAIVPTLMTTSTIICIYLLRSILKMGKLFVAEQAEEEFMANCRAHVEKNRLIGDPPVPRRTFERFWEFRCEDDWKTSFRLFSWGISFFLGLLCTMGFIKFAFETWIAIIFASIIGVFFLIWLAAQVTWGTYLQKGEAESGSIAASRHSVWESLSLENPFKWHRKSSWNLVNVMNNTFQPCQI